MKRAHQVTTQDMCAMDIHKMPTLPCAVHPPAATACSHAHSKDPVGGVPRAPQVHARSPHLQMLDQFGFGPNCRGPNVCSFGLKAIKTFLDNHGLEFIIRAHEMKQEGLRVCQSEPSPLRTLARC